MDRMSFLRHGAAVLCLVVSTMVQASPPLTAKARMEAAETVVEQFLEELKTGLDETLKIRPKVRSAAEVDPQRRSKGILVFISLGDKAQSQLDLTCDVIGDEMQIVRCSIGTEWSNIEDDPSRRKILDQMEHILSQLLRIEGHSEKATAAVLAQWAEKRDPLLQIGRGHQITVEDVRYVAMGYHQKGKSFLRLGITHQASKSPDPYPD